LGLHIDLSYKFHDPGRFGRVKDPKLIEPDLLRRTRVLIPSINLKRLYEQDQRR